MTCLRDLVTLCISMIVAAGLTGCVESAFDPDSSSTDAPQPDEQQVAEQLTSAADPSSVADCQYDLVEGPLHLGPLGPVQNPVPSPNDTQPCRGPVH